MMKSIVEDAIELSFLAAFLCCIAMIAHSAI